jgi:hypothetical protein
MQEEVPNNPDFCEAPDGKTEADIGATKDDS